MLFSRIVERVRPGAIVLAELLDGEYHDAGSEAPVLYHMGRYLNLG